MTADFASNMNAMMALNSFTQGAYKYQYPTINGVQNPYMDPSIMASIPSIFQQAVVMANAGNMGNYAGYLGTDIGNMSLSTPAWLQNIGKQPYTPQIDLSKYFSFDFSGIATSASGAGSQSSSVTNPFAQSTVKNQELANELNKYGISSTGDEEKDKKALAKAKEKADKAKQEGSGIAGKIFQAVKGSGTNEEVLSAAVKSINKDNVMAVYEAWDSNSSFAQSFGEDDILGAIQDDCSGAYQLVLEEHLKNALYAKAQDLGMYNEAEAFKSVVESEHKSWHSSDSVVKEAFDKIVSQIKSKESQNSQAAALNNK